MTNRSLEPTMATANDLANRAETPESIVEAVKQRYGQIAEGDTAGCCGPSGSCCGPAAVPKSEQLGYQAGELGSVPAEANLGLGCGTPIDFLELTPGETVLDLGSGGGLDAFLAARRVGPDGRVIGVDMTPAMVARARHNATEGGFTNVDFREGRLEALPVHDGSVDAATSNCVINLVPDKAVVFRELARVLRPGGRLVIADIVLDGALPPTIQHDLLAYVGCIAGAMERGAYFALLESEGLDQIEVLRDVDAVQLLGDDVPDDIQNLVERTGARVEDLAGRVRSITFRARKPGASAARQR